MKIIFVILFLILDISVLLGLILFKRYFVKLLVYIGSPELRRVLKVAQKQGFRLYDRGL